MLAIYLAACQDDTLNSPYTKTNSKDNVIYASFISQPKTLDPARSYSEDEAIFTGQIYEPPFQYHYLKRPYELIPLTATRLPEVRYLNAQGNVLNNSAPDEQVAYSVYDIIIQPGIYYQPHPAFAKDEKGGYRYLHLSPSELKKIHTLSDFKYTGTRELIADDYAYEIKRLASPKVQSPIFGLMEEHIVGLTTFMQQLQSVLKEPNHPSFLDLREFPLQGVDVINRYHYRITLKGKYAQFIYWLAMPFFAPIPWEADAMYSQPELAKNNIGFDWYPVGTGPYMLIENNPNRRMVLEKNPNFHPEFYPAQGNKEDKKRGFLNDTGKRLPLNDRIEFYLEKESLPSWNKFLQGYYDSSTVGSDSFNQVIRLDKAGNPVLTDAMKQKHIQLRTSVDISVFYLGFNMLDDVVGGYSERARKLRQAIGIAIDNEEYINIFRNGRGIVAQSVIPPEVFGHRDGEQGINQSLYDWKNNHAEKKSLAYAKQLMKEAGYINGRDKQGKPLILNYDINTSGDPAEGLYFEWMRKQFAKIGIQLNIQATSFNRLQKKMRDGNLQIFTLGWIADYPDPENFLFLFYGPNSKVKYGGENVFNYENKQYDQWYEEIRNMPNDEARQAIIDKMINQLNYELPAIWNYYPVLFTLSHEWRPLGKPAAIGNNYLKYSKIDPQLRAFRRNEWNHPMFWPFIIIVSVLILFVFYMIMLYRKKQKQLLKR